MLTCYISSIISKSDMRCIIAQAIRVLTQTHKDYFYVAHLTPKCIFFYKAPSVEEYTFFFDLRMDSIVCDWYIPLCLGWWLTRKDGWSPQCQ